MHHTDALLKSYRISKPIGLASYCNHDMRHNAHTNKSTINEFKRNFRDLRKFLCELSSSGECDTERPLKSTIDVSMTNIIFFSFLKNDYVITMMGQTCFKGKYSATEINEKIISITREYEHHLFTFIFCIHEI